MPTPFCTRNLQLTPLISFTNVTNVDDVAVSNNVLVAAGKDADTTTTAVLYEVTNVDDVAVSTEVLVAADKNADTTTSTLRRLEVHTKAHFIQ